MAEFSPQELDQIEDLLEDLELNDDLPTDLLRAEARARLGEYREILLASREALGLEDPPAQLLSGVIAEARQSAYNSKQTAASVVSAAPEAAPAVTTQTRPWLRRWLPALALGASAAGVLLWLRPSMPGPNEESLAALDKQADQDDKGEGVAEQVASGAAAKQDRANAQPIEEQSGDEGQEAEAASEHAPSDDPQTPKEGHPAQQVPGSAKSGAAAKPSPKPSKINQSDAVPAQQDMAEPDLSVDKDQAWSDLTRAHQLRRRGECRSARALYRGLEHEGLKSNVRAQAMAGRGLCDEFDGSQANAEILFSKARQVRSDINGWISAEREEMLANGHSRKKTKAAMPAPAKSKHKKNAAPEAAQD